VVELIVIAKEGEIDEDGSTDITSIFTVLCSTVIPWVTGFGSWGITDIRV
jgi:hypothetical protein